MVAPRHSPPGSFALILLLLTFASCSAFGLSTSKSLDRRTRTTLLASAAAAGGDRRCRSSPSQGTHHSSYLATCIPGLSQVLADELTSLGCNQVQVTSSSAVSFEADLSTSLKTVLWTRTAHKIMERLCTSDPNIQSRDQLSQFVQDTINVKDLIGNGRGGLLTLSVQTLLNKPFLIPKDINHSHFTSLTIKNALCDMIRDMRDDRPDVELEDPDVPLVAVLLGTELGGAQVTLYRQLHAGSLHRRGYRPGAIHKAAMKESLAAGLLLHAGWKERVRARENDKILLVDPMAGSGSFLLEAAMMAANLAPGLMRIKCGLPGQGMPAVVRWKHEEDDAGMLWKELLLDATQQAKEGMNWLRSTNNIQMIGNDLHPGALELFETSLRVSGLDSVVQVEEGDCMDFVPSSDEDAKWFVVCNPPWGERLSKDMEDSWEALRHFLRDTCPPGTEAWVLSGNAAATKHLGLRRSQSLALKTGKQDLRWLQYIILDPSTKEERKERSAATEDEVHAKRRPESSSSAEVPSAPKKVSVKSPRKKVVDNEWLI